MKQVFDCDQNSDEWLRCRMGIPTASEFRTIIGVNKDAREKVTRKTYMLKLAGEILTGDPAESFTNAHMERGHVMEDEARDLYSFMYDIEPQRVGFIRNGNVGCSPDSLIGNKGALEIKTALPHILGAMILKDVFPAEHKAQTQGVLWIAEREFIDICVYWPKMPRFIKRAWRDEEYIKGLSDAVDQFNEELNETVELLRRYGKPANSDQPANMLMAG